MTKQTQSPAYLGASARAIRHHYDLSNEFFALWLDPTMTYSCALWEPGDTLERAQIRKLDDVLDGVRARGAARLLDVGCGWGSLLRRATESYGVRRAVGLTLSEQQADWLATRTLAPDVDVLVRNWVDYWPEEPYDAIVSIGAFEHFAQFGLSRSTRIECYRRFFGFCRSALRAGSCLAVQTTVKGNNRRMSRATVRDMEFVIERVFPESEIPALAEVVESSEGLFEVVSIRNDGDQYATTCQEWFNRLDARRDEAARIVGEWGVANYERYLGSFVEPFRNRHLGLARLVFEAV
jgi:cyclopropane-fatty-acyl-phospholipid synthase